MITSKFILNQIEQYSDTKNIAGHPVIIYENPTSSDIMEISKSIKAPSKEVRFIADSKTSKVYIWNAYLAIHRDILKQLNLTYSCETFPYILFGEAIINGNKLNFKTSDTLDNWVENAVGPPPRSLQPQQKLTWGKDRANQTIVKYFNFNWTFADKYVNGLNRYLKLQSSILAEWINGENK